MTAYETGAQHAGVAQDSPLRPRLDGRRPDDRPDVLLARARARWLRRCLDGLGERPASMLILGWDRGATNSELFANLHIRSLVTVDVAREPSHAGALRSADGKATFLHVSDYRATESADLAYTHGVLGHMPDSERAAAAVLVYRSLASGGLFAAWESNPWSPSVVMNVRQMSTRRAGGSITARETRRVLRGAGFDVIHTTSPLFFPQGLSWCQPLEPLIAPMQLGGEYMVLARKP